MALVHCDPFAHYASSQYTDIYTTASGTPAVGPYGPNGGPGWRFSGNSGHSVDLLSLTTSGSVCIIQADFRISLSPSSTNVILLAELGGLAQCSLDINGDRTMSVHRGFGGSKVQLGLDSSYVIPLNTFIHLGVKFTIDNGAGSIVVHVWEDGDTAPQVILNVSDDTQDRPTAFWDGFNLGAASPSTTDWANLVVMDGSGSTMNDLLGPVDVTALFASARTAPALSQWTLSAGSDEAALLDDAAPDDDVTYLSETTQDQQMTVAVDQVPHDDRVIYGAQLYASVKLASGSPTLRAIGYESATPNLGVTFAPSSTYRYLRGAYSAMPSGAAFTTAAAFDALQWGLKLTTASTGVRVTQLVVAVIQTRTATPVDTPEPPDYEIVIGDEEGINPLIETFRIQETLDGNTTLVCDVDSGGSPYTRFSLNDSVAVAENGVRIFGGVVTGLRERAFGGVNGGAIVVEVQATSYAINAKRRYLTQTVDTGPTLDEWLTGLIDDYLGDIGVSLHPDQTTGPTLTTFTFTRQLISQALDTVAQSIGYLWSIDFENRLRMWSAGDIDAPNDLDEDTFDINEVTTGDVEKEEQLQDGYANHITITGDPIQVNNRTDTFIGDGVEDTFELSLALTNHYGYLTVDGLPENVGTSPAQWLLDLSVSPNTIRRIAGPPGGGDVISFTYHGIFLPQATAFDAGEIATYGLWEYVEAISSVPDNGSAQDLADAILAQKLSSKDEFVTWQTRDRGYHPGQFQTITVPARVVSGEFLITQVDTFAESGGDLLLRKVRAAKSLNNNADWRKVYQQWYGVTGTHATTGDAGSTIEEGEGGTAGAVGPHATTHESGGIDPIQLDDLAAPSDNTDLNVSTSAHGLVPKITGSDGYVLTKSGSSAVWDVQTGSGSPGSVGFELIQEIICSGSTSTETFSGISGGYRHLKLVFMGRVTSTGSANRAIYMQFNGDSGSNYDRESTFATNVTTASDQTIGGTSVAIFTAPEASVTAGLAASGELMLPYYSETTFHKTGVAHLTSKTANASAGILNSTTTCAWRSTSAITSILLGVTSSGNFASGTKISLYGVS